MNILLINDSVRDYQVFVDSVNENTIPFVYGPTTSRFHFCRFLKEIQVNRIAIVFEIGNLLLGESFFDSDDYLNSLNIPHLDFLACNTLQFEEWKDFYAKLTSIVGASNNPTGNLQYGGDWLLESTSEDIENIYFTKSIEYYKYLLSDADFSFILKSDGFLYASGDNSYGQLGNGTTTNLNAYTNITQYQSASFKSKTVKSFHTTGYYHTLVLMTDNTLWGTGYNGFGQLGVSPVGNLFTLVPSFSVSPIAMISCGKFHTVAITSNNNVWVTGWGGYGQLGRGNTTDISTFTQVTGITGTIKAVSCGSLYTVILTSANKLWVTGDNGYGQLGTGNTTNISTFTIVNVDTITGKTPIHICASLQHTMVAMSDGSIWVVGIQYNIGINARSPIEQTTFIIALNTNSYYSASRIPVKICAGQYHTLVLMSDGTLWGTGLGMNYSMASNSSYYVFTQITIPTTLRTLCTTGFSSILLGTNNTTYVTGQNNVRQLGISSTSDVTTFTLSQTSVASLSDEKNLIIPIISITSISPSSGVNNSTITLTGLYMNTISSLTVNGVSITSFTTTSTTVIFTIPAGTGTVTIIVTDTASNTSSTTFTYINPTVTSMTPLTGSANTVLTITGTNLGNVSKVLFNGISVIPTNKTSTTVTVSAPVNKGTVTITVVYNTNSIVTSPTLFTYVNANQPVATTTLTQFNTGSTDLQSYFKNSTQLVTFKPNITSQSQSMINTLSVYKKNISISMDGSPSGDTVITFGNRKKRVGWVAVAHGTNTIAYSYDGILWTGLGATIFAYGLAIGWNGTIWSAGGGGTNSLAYSYDGINWTGLGVNIFTTFCNGLVWNQTMCVAVGSGLNSIAYSYDGINWTGIGLSILTYGYAVNWNGHMWIAVGESPGLVKSMAYSYDGINWTNVPNFYTKITNGLAVAWNGSMWVAGGGGVNSLAYSYNGIDWTDINSGAIIGQVRGIAWNGTLWVAAGQGSNFTIAYSYDGKLWTGVTNSSTLTPGWGAGVSWNGKMFIMTGYPPNTLVYSYDGIHWIGLGASVITDLSRAICHSNRYENSIVIKRRRIVAGGQGANTLAYSTDGISWTGLGTSLFLNTCWGVAYNGRIWVAVGGNNVNIGWSLDGQNWNPVSTILYEYGLCIAWNGKMWVSGGSGTNTILYSYDGLQWFATANSKSIMATIVFSVDWNGTVWVAVGQGSTSIAYSYDGITWIPATNVFTTNGIKVVWNGKLFLAAGYGTNTLAYSYDGINNWTVVSTSINGHGLAWNGTMWMASDGAYSYDAINWSSSTYPISGPMYVIWTGILWLGLGFPPNTMAYSYDGIKWYGSGVSIFSGVGVCAASDLYYEYTNTVITVQTPVVAVGAPPNSIAYSIDGIQWKGLGNTIFAYGFAIAYSGSRWVAGGQGGHSLAYSGDGLNWIGLGATIFTTGCYEIAYNGKIWVAVGQGTNTIAYSEDGTIWTAVPNDFFTISNTVAWDGSKWIAGGAYNNTLATSTDGKSWSGVSHFSGIGLVIGAEYNGSLWIAGGIEKNTDYVIHNLTWNTGISWFNGLTFNNGKTEGSLTSTNLNKVPLIYSYNGLDWYPVPNPILTEIQSMAWNGQMWIVVGVGSSFSMIYSYDGIQWTGVPNSYALFPGGAIGITWNGLRWIACGNGSGSDSLAYSVDGLKWIGLGKTIMTSGYGIGPRIFDAKLGQGDDLLRFATDSYSQPGYSNITLAISNTI